MWLIGQVNRWTIAVAVVLTGFLALLASNTFSGHALGATASGTASATGATGTSGTSGTSGTGLAQPSSAPAPVAPAPSPVVSGGS